VSLTTKRSEAQAQVSKGLGHARKAATRVTPVAKSTGATAAQGIQNARAWAAPRIGQGVHDARGWAAPRIERAGHALEERIAPKVSGMMTATAHRVDPSNGSSSGRRVWMRIVAGVTLVSALGGIVAAILRKRSAKSPGEAMPDDMTGTRAEHTPEESDETEQVMVEAEIGVNGKGPTS
jgi:hypothetical protein